MLIVGRLFYFTFIFTFVLLKTNYVNITDLTQRSQQRSHQQC